MIDGHIEPVLEYLSYLGRGNRSKLSHHPSEKVIDSLDQPGRERLARDMIDSFTRLAERYVATEDTPVAPGPEVSTLSETGAGGGRP